MKSRDIPGLFVFVSILLACYTEATGQITWPDPAPIGRTIEVDIDTSISVAALDLAKTGEQSWIFTEPLDLWHAADKVLAVSGSPYESAFPTAQWVETIWQYIPSFLTLPDTIIETYTYRLLTDGWISELGMGTSHEVFQGSPFVYPAPSVISPVQISNETPAWLEYRVFQPKFLGLLQGIVRDSTIVQVDAWGDLTVPGGTYSCIRLKRHEFRKINALIVILELETYTYTWLTRRLDLVLSVTAQADTALPSNGEFFTTADYVVRATSPVEVAGGNRPSAEKTVQGTPGDWFLAQNYPNPFNSGTTIEYTVSFDGYVEIEVLDMLGRSVRTLFDGEQCGGTHQIEWDGLDEQGFPAPSGLYVYTMRGGGVAEKRKLLLIR